MQPNKWFIWYFHNCKYMSIMTYYQQRYKYERLTSRCATAYSMRVYFENNGIGFFVLGSSSMTIEFDGDFFPHTGLVLAEPCRQAVPDLNCKGE